MTEGLLTRRLLAAPSLPGVGAVILDEFHERHLQGDLALALLRRLQRTTRPDLRLVAMSATLDAAPVARYLGAPSLRSEGRRFEVAIEHLSAEDAARPGARLEDEVARAVRRLHREGADGDVLVFLPGAAEIRRARDALAAFAGSAGRRRAAAARRPPARRAGPRGAPGAAPEGDPLHERRRDLGHHRGRRRGGRLRPRPRRLALAVVRAPDPRGAEDLPRVRGAARRPRRAHRARAGAPALHAPRPRRAARVRRAGGAARGPLGDAPRPLGVRRRGRARVVRAAAPRRARRGARAPRQARRARRSRRADRRRPEHAAPPRPPAAGAAPRRGRRPRRRGRGRARRGAARRARSPGTAARSRGPRSRRPDRRTCSSSRRCSTRRRGRGSIRTGCAGWA